MDPIVESLLSGDAITSKAPKSRGSDPVVESLLSGGDGTSLTQGGRADTYYGVGDDVAHGASPKTAARASLATNVTDQIKRYAKARNLPESHYGVIDGNIVYWSPTEKKYFREIPAVFKGRGAIDTMERAAPFIGSQVGPLLPAVAAAGAGSVLGATPASIPAAGAVSGLVDVGRQALDKWLSDESVTDIDYSSVLKEGALGAMGQGLAVGGAKLLNRNVLGVGDMDRARALAPGSQAATRALLAKAGQESIDLTAGQATGLRSLLVSERQLGRYPETTDKLYEFAKTQREVQTPAAIRRQIAGISKDVGETGIKRFQQGAKDTIEQAIKARSAAASPHYQAAFESGSVPDVAPVLANIEDRLGGLAPSSAAARALNGIKSDLVGASKMDRPYEAVHSAKESADSVIDRMMKEGYPPSELKRARREIIRIKQDLQNTLEATHPSYAKGANIYREMSPGVLDLKEGGAGILAKMKPDDRVQLVRKMFDQTSMSPAEIAKSRQAYAIAGKSAEWDAGIANWLSDKLDAAMKINASGGRGNVPGKFSASTWGDDRQRKALVAALGDQDRVTKFGTLIEVLQAAAKGLPEGSPTATDMISQGLTAQGVGRIPRAVGAVTNPLEWGPKLADFYTQLKTPRARVKLADAMLSGDYDKELSKLRMLGPRSQKAAAVAGQMMSSILAAPFDGPSDFEAPAASSK